MNDLQRAFAIISLSSTAALLVLSTVVLIQWLPGAKVKPQKHTEWLILGVCTGFIGLHGDNIWWGIAWAMRLLDNPNWTWWFDNGVISNVIFRQGFKIVSSFCHLKAAVAFGGMTEEELANVSKASISVFALSFWMLVTF